MMNFVENLSMDYECELVHFILCELSFKLLWIVNLCNTK